MITTPTLLEQCGTGSCCMEARDEMVFSDTPPSDPRGVVKMDVAISSSLSENRRVLRMNGEEKRDRKKEQKKDKIGMRKPGVGCGCVGKWCKQVNCRLIGWFTSRCNHYR